MVGTWLLRQLARLSFRRYVPRRRRPSRRPPVLTLKPVWQLLEDRRLLNAYTVLNTSDTGGGSLRQAILDANANPGLDTINFAIDGAGTQTITPLSALPDVTDPVAIDATTQAGYAGSPVVQISGTSAGVNTSGFMFTSSAAGSSIRGLSVINWNNRGIYVLVGNVTVAGNYLGLNAAGAAAANGVGVDVQGWSGCVIGGTALADRNVISGNTSYGVVLDGGATNNSVQGNYVGTNVAGTAAVGNAVGVYVNSSGNTIGGTAPGAGNVISGNTTYGVEIQFGFASGNVVQGNTIGLNAAGTAAVANLTGVSLDHGTVGNVVGGQNAPISHQVVTSGGNLQRPGSIAVAPNGTIYVIDAADGVLWRVNPVTGAQTYVSSGNPFFSFPSGVAVGPSGDLYIDQAG